MVHDCSTTAGPDCPRASSAPRLTRCVTLGQSLNFSVPHCLHLQEDRSRSSLQAALMTEASSHSGV